VTALIIEKIVSRDICHILLLTTFLHLHRRTLSLA